MHEFYAELGVYTHPKPLEQILGAIGMELKEIQKWTCERSALVVEDDSLALEAFRQMLSYLFAEVHVAANGQVALDQLASHHYDVIFTDLRMPQLSGFRLIEEARQRNPEQSIIIISAFDTDVVEQAQAIQGLMYLLKPVSLDELLKVLASLAQNLRPDNPASY